VRSRTHPQPNLIYRRFDLQAFHSCMFCRSDNIESLRGMFPHGHEVHARDDFFPGSPSSSKGSSGKTDLSISEESVIIHLTQILDLVNN
jgi:hypothetical protein